MVPEGVVDAREAHWSMTTLLSTHSLMRSYESTPLVPTVAPVHLWPDRSDWKVYSAVEEGCTKPAQRTPNRASE